MNDKIQETIKVLREEMKSIFKERDDEVDGLLIAMLSKQHILLIGPRGTAKSLMIRKLSSAITGAEYWERLFTKFTVPDEVFGPIKLSALKQDKFERQVQGHLPTANFAFADEIFKANSSILNALLTLTNERIFHNNGDALNCPLETMMGASNELPQDESLAALYDRFLLRYKVKYIEEDGAFRDMMGMKDADISAKLTFEQLADAQGTVAAMPIPDSVMDAVVQIRNELRKEGIMPSDRRYREAQKILKAFSYLQGKSQVDTDDIAILKHCLWDEPTHISTVERVVISVANPQQRTADELMDAIHSAWKAVEDVKGKDDAETKSLRVSQGSEAIAKIKSAREKLEVIRKQMADEKRDTSKVDAYLNKSESIIKQKILKSIMGIDMK